MAKNAVKTHALHIFCIINRGFHSGWEVQQTFFVVIRQTFGVAARFAVLEGNERVGLGVLRFGVDVQKIGFDDARLPLGIGGFGQDDVDGSANKRSNNWTS